MIGLPGVVEDGMPGANEQRKPGTARGSPRRSRTAKASRISRRAVKSRCAREWVGWGRLNRKIEDLHARVHRGAYRALPSRRHYIPKADGQQRPLAIAALEDKIVQKAACAVLNAIYEE